MNFEKNKTRKFSMAVTSLLLAATAALVLPTTNVRAQSSTPQPLLFNLQIDGFQSDSSSPFVVKGDPIGQGVWKHLIGPVLGTPFTLIPAAAGFAGATCQPEYSQDQITTSDGSTITANVTGSRCVPNDSPGAHTTIGVYSIVGGTGQFDWVTHGVGPITIDARADGSTSLFIAGAYTGGGGHRACAGGACGS
jgi:hypothetical protein